MHPEVVEHGAARCVHSQALDERRIAPARQTVGDHRRAMRGCRQYDSNTLIVGGGFSANSQLRAKLLEFGENYGVDVRIPQIKLCTDNGAMVAMLGVNLVEAGVAPSAPDFPIDSAMPLTKVSM